MKKPPTTKYKADFQQGLDVDSSYGQVRYQFGQTSREANQRIHQELRDEYQREYSLEYKRGK